MAQRTIKALGKTGRLSRTKVLSLLKTLRKQKKPNGAHQSNGKLAQTDTASGQGPFNSAPIHYLRNTSPPLTIIETLSG